MLGRSVEDSIAILITVDAGHQSTGVIGQERLLVLVHKDVPGFQIPVSHFGPVKGFERPRQLEQERPAQALHPTLLQGLR